MELRVCLLEGRYEHETREITKKFMPGMRKLIDDYTPSADDTYAGSFSMYYKIDKRLINFTVELYVDKTRALEMEGLYTPHSDYDDIVISIVLPAARRDYLESIRVELFDGLRHEIEHAFKERKRQNNDVGDDKLEKLRAELLEPDEIGAWVAGLYKRAKTLKRPFAAVAARELNRISKGRATQLMDVLDAWKIEAKRRFPAAKL